MNAKPVERGAPSCACLFHPPRIPSLLCLMLLLGAIPTASWGSVAGKVRRGNKEYYRENFDQALRHYRDAQLEDPESPPLHYNIANALYKQQNWEEAMAEYGMTLSGQDSSLAAGAYYNMGNTLYRQGHLGESIEAYKRTLRIDPTDMDAKYNLELAQRKLQENEQQSQDQQPEKDQQEQQEQGGQQQQQQDQRPQEEQEKNQREQELEGEGERPQEQQAREGQEEEQESSQPERPGQMSPEEAAQLLNALKEQEKRAQEEYRRAQIGKGSKTEWDW